MKLQDNNHNLHILMDNKLDISCVKSAKEVLNKALLTNNNIVLDAKNLTKIDTAGLQLLLSFLLTVRQKKLSCQWVNVSEYLVKSAGLLGMEQFLQI